MIPPHDRESGFDIKEGWGVASNFRSAAIEPLSSKCSLSNRSCLRSGPRTGLSR